MASKRRQHALKIRRHLHAHSEAEVADLIELARDVLPGEIGKAHFAFAIRQLWQQHRDGDEPISNWTIALPALYHSWLQDHAFLLQSCPVIGQPSDEGLAALARLLVDSRQRQKLLEAK